MKKITLWLILLFAQATDADEVSESLQAKLNAIHSMTASFTQVVKARQHQMSKSSGTMALSRPGRFRWQTLRPMAQWVIADGQHLWVYDVDLEQVTVKKQDKGLGGTAALFLTNDSDTVTRDFDVTSHKEGQQDVFDLHPKSHKANFQRVILLFHQDVLTGMELFDQLGQRTIIHLSHIKKNPPLNATLFQFKTPKGVDKVEQ